MAENNSMSSEPLATIPEIIVDLLSQKKSVFLTGYAGTGKCLGIDTPILMYDGTIKMVQDVMNGDMLMGDDSTSRNVLSTTRGIEQMYRVVPKNGECYIVNESHIISLVTSYRPHVMWVEIKKSYNVAWRNENGKQHSKNFSLKVWGTKESAFIKASEFQETCPMETKIDISITEYMSKTLNEKKQWKGYRVKVDFPEKETAIDPYLLGLWLGDGSTKSRAFGDSKSNPIITNTDSIELRASGDPEIIEYFRMVAETMELNVKPCKHDTITCVFSAKLRNGLNIFRKELRNQNLINNKHVPHDYKCNSREKRLKLLAGLVDSDGFLTCNCYEIVQKLKTLTDDILYVARSLGFAAYTKECQKSWTYDGVKKTGTYWRTFISGDITEIPVLIPRKMAAPRKQIKNHLKTGITIEKLDIGDYYGFEIDGNHRFLLGDFTVTHNTFYTREIIALCEERNIKLQQCGTTGISSIQLPNGRTLHSTFCLPTDFPDQQEIISRAFAIKKSKFPKSKITVQLANEMDVLIIDEISMASAWLMDTLDIFLRIFRNKHEPMGGVSILAVGDLLQLPPVYRKTNNFKKNYQKQQYSGKNRQRLAAQDKDPPITQQFLAIDSRVWYSLVPITILLTDVKRQKDADFSNLLNQVRFGMTLSIHEKKLLSDKNSHKEKKDSQICWESMYIAVRRKTVHDVNEQHFEKLRRKHESIYDPIFFTFPYETSGNPMLCEELIRDLRLNLYMENADVKQKFIMGQRVMCVSNITENNFTLVNGDTGTIIGYEHPIMDVLNMENCLFQSHMFTTLSDGSSSSENSYCNDGYPVVKFDRTQELIIVITKKYTRFLDFEKKDTGSVWAIPLIPCFASTVHKVQGCTLCIPIEIDCDCMDWFAGTFYVALSRATSLENVTFINFNGKYKALQRSLEFYTQGYVMDEKNSYLHAKPGSSSLDNFTESLLKNKAYIYVFCGNTVEHVHDNFDKNISNVLTSLDLFRSLATQQSSNDEFTTKMEEFSAKIEEFSTGEWEKDVEIFLHPVLNFLQRTCKVSNEENSLKRKQSLLHVELDKFMKDEKKIKK